MSEEELECDVFDLLCSGLNTRAVANRLGVKDKVITEITAKYREAIKRDNGLKPANQRRASLTAMAFGDPPIGRSALDMRQ